MSKTRDEPRSSPPKTHFSGVASEKDIFQASAQGASESTSSGNLEVDTDVSDTIGRNEGDEEKGEPSLNFLQRALTTRSEVISSRDPGPPPDGGMKAWLQGVY